MARRPKSEVEDGGAVEMGGGLKLDPVIYGLLLKLPAAGEYWSDADRKLWLSLLEGAFKLIYTDTQEPTT